MAPRFSASTATCDRAVRGDHENRRFAVARANFFEHLHAALVGHHQVEQDQIVGGRFQALLSFGRIGGQLDAVVFAGEERFQALADVGLVVDDQNAAAHGVGRRCTSGGKFASVSAITASVSIGLPQRRRGVGAAAAGVGIAA